MTNTPNQELLSIARENFKKWNTSLQTKDPMVVAELYTIDSTFLPTVSGEFKKGQNGAQEYFTHFLQKDPFGKITDEEVQELDDNHYLHSGMYTFEVGPVDNRQTVSARFTYVWRKGEAGEWKVILHHSSMRPQ